jgi:cell division septation protein DedD
MNMSDDLKQKKFYSLNLSEGRILIIFICVVLFITVTAFCVTFLFFSKNKANDVKLKTTESTDLTNNTKKDYYGLSNDSGSSLIDKESNGKEDVKSNDSIEEKNSSAEINDDSNSKNESTTVADNKKKDGESIKSNLAKNEDNFVKTDDSEVLYSSKYNKNSKKNLKKSESKPQANNKTKEKQQKKEILKNYIVQIGSYTNKKIAEDISTFYQKQGYSPFIVTKELSGKTFFRLRVGPYKEKDAAIKQLNDLKKSKYGDNSYLSIVYI